jgi:hypothetical protein
MHTVHSEFISEVCSRLLGGLMVVSGHSVSHAPRVNLEGSTYALLCTSCSGSVSFFSASRFVPFTVNHFCSRFCLPVSGLT